MNVDMKDGFGEPSHFILLTRNRRAIEIDTVTQKHGRRQAQRWATDAGLDAAIAQWKRQGWNVEAGKG